MTAIATHPTIVPAARMGARPGKLRLTTRGRRVLAALVLAPAAVGVGAILTTAAPAGASSQAVEVEFHMITVQAGDSLWSIASDHAGGRDVREVMDDIMRLNGLTSMSVEPGQHLAMPLS